MAPAWSWPSGQRERLAVERDQGGERQPLFLIQPGHAHLALVGAEHENLRVAVAVPVRDRQVADARQGGEGLRGSQRAVRLLEIDGKLAALRLGDEQVGQAVAVDIGPAAGRAGPCRSAVSGQTWNWPWRKEPESCSAGLRVNSEICARPEFWAMVITWVFLFASRLSAQ